MTYIKEKSPVQLFNRIDVPVMKPEAYLCDVVHLDGESGKSILIASQKHWKEKEKIWYGDIPREKTYLGEIEEVYRNCKMFFLGKHHKKDIPDDYIWDYEFQGYLEHFPKIVWLTNEYIKSDKNFKNAICSHWNPRGGVINIHPGGCRQLVLHLFGKEGIPAFFFNTSEYYDTWMDDLREVDIDELYNTTPWQGDVVADHGTLIPHLIRDTDLIPAGKDKWFKKIRQKYESGWKIYIQNNMTIFGGLFNFLGDFITTNKEDANVIVNFDISEHKIWSTDRYIDVYRVSKSVVGCFADIDIDEDGISVHHIN